VGMATVLDTDAMEALANADFRNSPQSTTLIIDGEVVPLTITGTEAGETINGKAGANNVIAGLEGDDDISGKGKDDKLFGNSGDDTLNGGNGNDHLYGCADNDVLIGGNGNDRLKGGTGNDVLYGGNGNDFLQGGEGGDLFLFDAGNKKAGVDIVSDYNVLEDELAFTTAPVSVTFDDTGAGARMFVNGKLAAVFEGVTASEMAGEWVI
jgi:Ca2+-binding RTX toxin-like protein